MADIEQFQNGELGPSWSGKLNELVNRANDGGKFYGYVTPTDLEPSTLKEGATVLPSINGIYPNYGNLERLDGELCGFVYESGDWIKKTYFDITNDVTGNKISGYFLDLSGNADPLAGQNITDYIPVLEGYVMSITCEIGAGASAAWYYDSNNVPISEALPFGAYDNHDVTVPSGVAFIRAGGREVPVNPLLILKVERKIIDFYKSDIDAIDAKADANASDILDYQDITGVKVSGEWVDESDGITAVNGDYSRSGFVTVTPNEKVYFTGTIAEGFGMVVYGVNQDYIKPPFTASGTNTYNRLEVTIPIGAEFIIIANRNLSTPESDWKIERKTGLIQDVDNIESEYLKDENLNEVRNFVNETGGLIPITAIVGSTGALITVAGKSTTELKPVVQGDIIYITATNDGNNLGVLSYYNGGAFVESPIINGVVLDREKVVIPAGVSGVRISGTSTEPLKLERVAPTLMSDIIVEKISDGVGFVSTRFLVHSKDNSTGEYISHRFVKWDDTNANTDDHGWYSDAIFHGDKEIAAGEFNWIHMIAASSLPENPTYDEGDFVGITHGCEHFDAVRFYCGGSEFDPTTMALGDKIEGNIFRMWSKSTIFAVSESASQAAGYQGVLKLELGQPIPSTRHWMDISIKVNNNLHIHNKLEVLRDNIEFSRNMIGMVNPTVLPISYMPDIALFCEDDVVHNRLGWDGANKTLTPLSGSRLLNYTRTEQADEAIQWDSSGSYPYMMKSQAWNKVNSEQSKMNVLFNFNESNNKIYYQPVVTTINATDTGQSSDVFNTGDKIEGDVKTEISL